MKKIIAFLLILPMMFGCLAYADSSPAEEAPLLKNDLYVLFTSDVHSGVESGWTYVGLEGIRDKLKADGNNVLLVDNGDSVQGEALSTTTKGEAIIELMNKMGYDLATIGNHEFDFGMEQFFKLTEMAEFEYVSCNFNHNGELCFKPYHIFDVDGAKVAFVGVSTPTTLKESRPTNFMDEKGNYIYGFFEDKTGKGVYDAVQKAVDSAREEGADYVILMAHLGNEEAVSPWTYADVISNTTGVDAVLDGHSHDLDKVSMLNKDGVTVLRQGCGTKLEGIGYLKIAVDGTMETGVWEWHNDKSLPELLGTSSKISSALTDATAELKKKFAEVVATTAFDLTTHDSETGVRLVRNQETNIADLCADAYLYISGADIAFLNGGAVRASIPKGDITLNDIYNIHPFGNFLCVCEATGQEILDALELSAHMWPNEFGGWLTPSSTLTYEVHSYIDSSVELDENGQFVGVNGEYRVKNVKIKGEALDLEKTYTVACHEFELKNMGDGYCMFADNVFTQNEIMIDNQVLITYIQDALGGVVGEEYAEPQGRVTFVETAPAK